MTMPTEFVPREPRPIEGVVTLSLMNEISALKREPSFRANGRNAKTLVKEHDVCVVLMIFQEGMSLHKHKESQSAIWHVLSGGIEVRTPSGNNAIWAGQMISVRGAEPHDVRALEESIVLLTMGGVEWGHLVSA